MSWERNLAAMTDGECRQALLRVLELSEEARIRFQQTSPQRPPQEGRQGRGEGARTERDRLAEMVWSELLALRCDLGLSKLSPLPPPSAFRLIRARIEEQASGATMQEARDQCMRVLRVTARAVRQDPSKQRLLTEVCFGEKAFSYALSLPDEAEGGSDATAADDFLRSLEAFQ